MRNNTNISPLSSRWLLLSCLGYVFLLSTLSNASGRTVADENSKTLYPVITSLTNPALSLVKTEDIAEHIELQEEPKTEGNEPEKQEDKVTTGKFLRKSIRPSSTNKGTPALVLVSKDGSIEHAQSTGESETETSNTQVQEEEEYDYESFHSKFDIPAPALRATLMTTMKISPQEQKEMPIDIENHHLEDC